MIRSVTSRMVSFVASGWGSVERWSPSLFLVGGVLLLGHATVAGVRAFTDLATPPDVFAATGHFVALVGLLGLVPVLEGRTIGRGRVAITVALVALGSWFVMALTQFLAFAGVVSSIETALPGVFFLIVLGSTVLTYGLFGVAALRVDTRSHTVGLLVLAPGGLTAALVVVPAVTGGTALDSLVIGGGLAVSMLALGDTLLTWRVRHERTAVADDVATG